MNDWFNKFASKASSLTGRSLAFFTAVGLIFLWLLSGPLLGFGDTWQLIINTLTTLITFLMVFLIQNSQNRSDNAMQIKLDLLLRMNGIDDKEVRELENYSDEELEEVLKRTQETGRTTGRKAKKSS